MKTLLVLLFVLIGSVVAQFNQDTLKRWMKSGPSAEFILIDLRGASDNITQVIANDQCKPYNLVWPDEFKTSVTKIPKDKHVVVYCRSGGRSSQAYSYLVSEGYTNAHDAGGFSSWTDTVRAFTESALMADSLLPAPSMLPFSKAKCARFSKDAGLQLYTVFNSDIADFRSISLNGRIVRNYPAVDGIVIKNTGLMNAMYRKQVR